MREPSYDDSNTTRRRAMLDAMRTGTVSGGGAGDAGGAAFLPGEPNGPQRQQSPGRTSDEYPIPIPGQSQRPTSPPQEFPPYGNNNAQALKPYDANDPNNPLFGNGLEVPPSLYGQDDNTHYQIDPTGRR